MGNNRKNRTLLLLNTLPWVFLWLSSWAWAGNLFVIDSSDGSVQEFNESTGALVGPFGETTAQLNTPVDLVFNPVNGNLFVADAGDNDVKEFDGDTGLFLGSFGETSANVGSPVSLAFNPSNGKLFVSDGTNNDIRVFNGSTGLFEGTFGPTGDVGILDSPGPITFNGSGNLFAAEFTNGDIREFDGSSGAFLGVFNNTAANLTTIEYLAFSSSNVLFVADPGNSDVRNFNSATETFIGSFGDTAANQTTPVAITFGLSSENLFVADSNGSIADVREYDISTGALVGSFGQTAANLTTPVALGFKPNVSASLSPQSRVVSPYWQSDAVAYTFLAISHSSLAGMSSEIGVFLDAVLDTTGESYGRAEFTVSAKTTQKIFIVASNDSLFIPENFSDSIIVAGSEEPSFGQLFINHLATEPDVEAGGLNAVGRGFPDVTLLNYWGVVVVRDNSTGFAMEFIIESPE